MKNNLRSLVILAVALVTITTADMVRPSSIITAQDADPPKFRSRSEQVAEQRKIEKAFPELVRALRTLGLPPDKMNEATNKLRQSEAATRAARQELQLLEEENDRQGCGPSTNSARRGELRASLRQSTDQLHSEIKTLLTPQQCEQFDRHLQRPQRQPQSTRERIR